MKDDYYYWDCTNPECLCINNRVAKILVKRAITNGKKIHAYCANCGFSPASVKLDLNEYTGTAAQACQCIPYTGDASRLPMPRDMTGFYPDHTGTKHAIRHYLALGIMPDIYLDFVKHNKMPREIDLMQFY